MKTDVVSFHNIDELNLVIIYWHNGEYSIMLSEPGIEREKDYKPYNFIIFDYETLSRHDLIKYFQKGYDCIEIIMKSCKSIKQTILTVQSHYPKAQLCYLSAYKSKKREILRIFPKLKIL